MPPKTGPILGSPCKAATDIPATYKPGHASPVFSTTNISALGVVNPKITSKLNLKIHVLNFVIYWFYAKLLIDMQL